MSQSKNQKTNTIRLLEQAGIQHRLLPYTYDPDQLAVDKIAEENGLPLEQLYKTLVLEGNATGPVVAVIPGHQQLQLKALAISSGNKKVAMVAVKDLQQLTGYIRGGCSPIGMKKDYPVVLDQQAVSQEQIFVNAGTRGLLVGLSPHDLQRITRALLAEISE